MKQGEPRLSGFEIDLIGFVNSMVPEREKTNFSGIIRGDLNLNQYEFKDAEVKLLPSINGHFKVQEEINSNGLMKFHSILKANKLGLEENAKIYFTCTSYGKVVPKVL